jgi:hypothetical protein
MRVPSKLRFALVVAVAIGAVAPVAEGQIAVHGSWSLTLDHDGKPRVSYVIGHLWLASRVADGIWSYEPVTDGVPAPRWEAGTSLAVDAAGDPFIAYSGDEGGLALARRTGGTWSAESVDPQARATGPSLALDGEGRPRVAYVDEISGSLEFCAWDGVSWSTETVAAVASPEAYVPFAGSLALESDGDPCISYFDYLDSHLKLASRHSGVWSIEVVQGPMDATWSSLALEADDDPCVGFRDAAGDLRLASRHVGQWEIETVDHVGSAVGRGVIRLDAAESPCASYVTNPAGELRFAEKEDGTWSAVTVDTGIQDMGTGPALALDAQGVPHLAYEKYGLQYATRPGTVWQTETIVLWPGSVGERPSRPLRLAAWPNPVGRGALQVAFSLPGGANEGVELLLHDVTGRRVATLYRGTVSPETRVVSWTAWDERGRPLPGGVYLLSARGSHGEASDLKVVVLR